jgi:molybdopterin-guanine dinucleotide biosynthesis protein
MKARVIVVGGHTRNVGKTQLVCDVIAAFPEVNWVAGKITQYGHGVCAQNGHDCDCAPDEHICAIEWETSATSGTDSARFLAAGAKRSFWLRTKQGFLAEGLPLLRESLDLAMRELGRGVEIGEMRTGPSANLRTSTNSYATIIESNSLMGFMKPSLYLAVVDPTKEDFKDSARAALDRADVIVLRGGPWIHGGEEPVWMKFPAKLLREKPSVIQREGEELPEAVQVLVQRVVEGAAEVVV